LLFVAGGDHVECHSRMTSPYTPNALKNSLVIPVQISSLTSLAMMM
jgi:hypothetical protein